MQTTFKVKTSLLFIHFGIEFLLREDKCWINILKALIMALFFQLCHFHSIIFEAYTITQNSNIKRMLHILQSLNISQLCFSIQRIIISLLLVCEGSICKFIHQPKLKLNKPSGKFIHHQKNKKHWLLFLKIITV